MKKNIFDKMSDSYEKFHFKDSEVHVGNDTLYISPRIKLILGWSLFILCCVLAYALLGNPFVEKKNKGISQEQKQEILEQEVDEEKEHATMVPYEKDDNEDLNAFIDEYFTAVTSCDNVKLQDMVTDPSEYSDNEALKKKADFITKYDNLTVYTKDGLDEGSYVAFVVSNLTITGVNSAPFDIVTLYIVTGAQGFRIVNGELSEETKDYIAKIKGDKDIQKVFQSVEKENGKLKEKDDSLKEFYEIISRRDVETESGADDLTTEAADGQESTGDGAANDDNNDNAAEEAPAEEE
ncbi:MAG: hypothetical protein IJ661_08260 [Lachnospiraceae bacterium]|nr:hypothetical protein [Lachnospiraceae bacterium]